MTRYIDAHKVENLLRMCGTYHGVISFDTVIDVLHDTVTADVVEVVRCEKCKHSSWDELGKCYWCKGKERTADFFCADGERRDDEKHRTD